MHGFPILPVSAHLILDRLATELKIRIRSNPLNGSSSTYTQHANARWMTLLLFPIRWQNLILHLTLFFQLVMLSKFGMKT